MAKQAVEHVRRLRGGAQSHLLRCDDGDYYVVKFKNNPQGVRILANEMLAGQAGNMPRVTGAAHPVVLGVVTPGRGCRISVDSKVKI